MPAACQGHLCLSDIRTGEAVRGITVRQLIQLLGQQDPDAPLCVAALRCEGDALLDDLSDLVVKTSGGAVQLNTVKFKER